MFKEVLNFVDIDINNKCLNLPLKSRFAEKITVYLVRLHESAALALILFQGVRGN